MGSDTPTIRFSPGVIGKLLGLVATAMLGLLTWVGNGALAELKQYHVDAIQADARQGEQISAIDVRLSRIEEDNGIALRSIVANQQAIKVLLEKGR